MRAHVRAPGLCSSAQMTALAPDADHDPNLHTARQRQQRSQQAGAVQAAARPAHLSLQTCRTTPIAWERSAGMLAHSAQPRTCVISVRKRGGARQQ